MEWTRIQKILVTHIVHSRSKNGFKEESEDSQANSLDEEVNDLVKKSGDEEENCLDELNGMDENSEDSGDSYLDPPFCESVDHGVIICRYISAVSGIFILSGKH